MSVRAAVGDWVQIEETVLDVGERAPQVPEDTQKVPLIMRVKGFATEEADLGDDVTVETIIGRKVRGKLVDLEPRYEHDFGRPVVELISVGREARQMLQDILGSEGGEGT